MFQIVETPEPPYYAVIAPAVLATDVRGYPEMAMRLMEAAREVDGFLGIEAAIQGRFALAVSYWRSLEAIDAWRHHARHLVAKELGTTRWFEAYFTRIARVERHY
ncbi:MAG TPA: antibiotic biosynthesis monooxygenase [Candidatus Binatia bacterium]|jgi:heme-degrading monooxygenase HmoA|nr:antibiotic biosynthesis monooxygenase [Candidatus Binatia bacterium]